MAEDGTAAHVLSALLLALAALVTAYLLAPGAFDMLFGGVATSTIAYTTTAPASPTPTSIYTTTAPSTTSAYTTVPPSNVSQYVAYALQLINKDRSQYGLTNVTLSNEPSGQQHSDSMLNDYYFSHWDTYGMKPYMRYTLLGGLGSVDENIAYESHTSCLFKVCEGTLTDIEGALQSMEYSMMYNDSACCNNGHRDNILDPYHNQVSIGIAYNSSTILFTEDFIDDYITWAREPTYSKGEFSMQGSASGGYSLASVQIGYDQPIMPMTHAQLNATRSYGYGDTVAGVVRSSQYYYANITTIVADRYSTGGGSFYVSFPMGNLTSQYGAGEYTVQVWLEDAHGQSFVGSTYTIFIGSNGNVYIPQNA